MPDRDAVRDHFASAIAAYRFAAGAGKWSSSRLETSTASPEDSASTHVLQADR